MIVSFALLNNQYGNSEMAQTLMDEVVTSYPKRVDVWAQYVDMLVKSNLIDSARYDECFLIKSIYKIISLKLFFFIQECFTKSLCSTVAIEKNAYNFQ